MNILHIIEDFSLQGAGLRTVIKNLNEQLNQLGGFNSIVLSSSKEKNDLIRTVNMPTASPWLYSKDWKKKIELIIQLDKVDVIHIHGVWMYPQYIAVKIALKNKIPFVITPHGMYEPWLWTKGTVKKKLYFKFLTSRLFSKSNVIHAITHNEKKNLRNLFPKNKIIEIPNLIDFNDYSNRETRQDNEKYILYLGRLHQVKGIEILIKAFYELEDKKVILKIAGGFNSYKIKLESLITELNLKNRVQFLGLVKGDEKLKLFRNAFVFVAPSYSEVIGMVNLEAATQKTPVITTFNTGLKHQWSDNGGILINPKKDDLTIALMQVLDWNNRIRNEKGKKLFRFVKENYSWETKLKDWINLYSSLKPTK